MTIEQFAKLRERVLNDGSVENIPAKLVNSIVWLLRHSKCNCEYMHSGDGVCLIFKHVGF